MPPMRLIVLVGGAVMLQDNAFGACAGRRRQRFAPICFGIQHTGRSPRWANAFRIVRLHNRIETPCTCVQPLFGCRRNSIREPS